MIGFPALADDLVASNLLANPGFEDLAGASPLRWDVFVEPREGASGKVSDEAHSGKRSVQLQIATPYEKDPLNNWSQNVIGEHAGKKMRLSGFIKVVEAKDAAIIAQCWRKEPWGVLSVATTSTRAPVYGTKDWDEVFAEFDVPNKTDFITVRCVLTGSGTAWFDDVSLTEIGDAPIRPDAIPEKPMAERPKPKTSALPKRATSITGLGQDVRDQAEMIRLREENRMLKDTVESLKSSNEDLEKRMKTLEEKTGEAKTP